MIKQCAVCGDDFEAKRSTAKYCSNRCKMEYRNNKNTDPILKVARAGYTSIKSLIWIEHTADNEQDQVEARRHLIAMFESLSKFESEFTRWECKNCGQKIFVEPTPKQACQFCGKYHGWS